MADQTLLNRTICNEFSITLKLTWCLLWMPQWYKVAAHIDFVHMYDIYMKSSQPINVYMQFCLWVWSAEHHLKSRLKHFLQSLTVFLFTCALIRHHKQRTKQTLDSCFWLQETAGNVHNNNRHIPGQIYFKADSQRLPLYLRRKSRPEALIGIKAEIYLDWWMITVVAVKVSK